ncbi:MAG: DUF1295 domain-containing protein [Bacilli bacterium]|nr:DUF1295 domain-containing protein [Bacilli bacterium]
MKKNKILGIIVILCAYIISFGVGAFLHFKINLPIEQFLLKLLIIDIAMTIVIFIFSWIFDNSSIYDPYWSVIPIACSIYSAQQLNNFNAMSYIMIALVGIWGVRLTFNFFKTFKNLDKQDWRYDHFKNKFPKLWPLINLTGIHLFPTLVVFTLMLSIVKYMETCGSVEINVSTIIAIVITVAAIIIESVADYQMHKFLKVRKNNELINAGLWKRSRHPNYFGEILFWWGIYLVMLSLNENMWVLFLGPMLNTLMFAFISVPLAEKHQIQKNPAYLEYKKTTNTFLLFPKKEQEK